MSHSLNEETLKLSSSRSSRNRMYRKRKQLASKYGSSTHEVRSFCIKKVNDDIGFKVVERCEAVCVSEPQEETRLRDGDVILQIDGHVIKQVSTATDLLLPAPPGTKWLIFVHRQKESTTEKEDMMSSERPSNFFQPQPTPLTTSVENTIEHHLPNYSKVDEFVKTGLTAHSSWNPEAAGKNSQQTRISSELVNKSKENTTSLDTNGKTPKPDDGHSKGQISPVTFDIATQSSNYQRQKMLSGSFKVGGVEFQPFLIEVILGILKLSELSEGTQEYSDAMAASHKRMTTAAGHHLIRMCKCLMESTDRLDTDFTSVGQETLDTLRTIDSRVTQLLANTPMLAE